MPKTLQNQRQAVSHHSSIKPNQINPTTLLPHQDKISGTFPPHPIPSQISISLSLTASLGNCCLAGQISLPSFFSRLKCSVITPRTWDWKCSGPSQNNSQPPSKPTTRNRRMIIPFSHLGCSSPLIKTPALRFACARSHSALSSIMTRAYVSAMVRKSASDEEVLR
jgi:hypothetical protein